jgi:hypothetical protein
VSCHPWRGLLQVQPQSQAPPLLQVQLVVQPQPQEQAAAGVVGWVMGVEQVQVMGFLLGVWMAGERFRSLEPSIHSPVEWRVKQKQGGLPA